MITHETQITNTQPGEPERKPDEPAVPDAPLPKEMPTTEPQHFPTHRPIPEQPIHEPMLYPPRA